MIIAVIILTVILIVLAIYNITINKKVKALTKTSKKVDSLNVLQDFMNIVGDDNTVEVKLDAINAKLREKFNIKYSTIVVFDGAEYVIKATNVTEQHWEKMKNLSNLEIFKESVVRGVPQYMTVNNDSESLPYQSTELGRAKSAIFFPLYIGSVYIGYWIIENAEKHAFDRIDLSIIEIVKENIISVLKTIAYQITMEGLVRKDYFTGLNSAEYLYGEGKLKIDKYVTSQICMFKLNNLEEINEQYGRNAGNALVTTVGNIVRDALAAEYIFVRYMGPKFAIAFLGEQEEEVIKFIQRLKRNLDLAEVEIFSVVEQEKIYIKPVINFVISTYYKATGLEKLNKKLELYLDTAKKTENDINYL